MEAVISQTGYAKMPTSPMSRLRLDLRPGARRTAGQRRCSRLEASAS
jgi:hypothetical protein